MTNGLTNKEIRQKASVILCSKGRWHNVVLGVCICIVAAIMPVFVLSFFSLIAAIFQGAEIGREILMYSGMAAFAAAEVFIAFPVIGGFLLFSYKLYKNDKAHISQLFYPFVDKGTYFKILKCAFLILLRVTFLCTIPAISVIASQKIIEMMAKLNPFMHIVSFFGAFASVALSVALAVVLAFLTAGGYLIPYFMCKGFSVSDASRMSARAMRGKKYITAKYIFGFTGVIIISLLTVGMLFVVYTLPVMIFAYFIYADQITENINIDISEES